MVFKVKNTHKKFRNKESISRHSDSMKIVLDGVRIMKRDVRGLIPTDTDIT